MNLNLQVVGALAGSMINFALSAIVGLTGVILPKLMDDNDKDLNLDQQEAALFSKLLPYYLISMSGM